MTIRLVFDLFERFRTVGKVLTYLVEHDIKMPIRVAGGSRQGRTRVAPGQPTVAIQSVCQPDLRWCLRVWRASNRSAAAEAWSSRHRA